LASVTAFDLGADMNTLTRVTFAGFGLLAGAMPGAAPAAAAGQCPPWECLVSETVRTIRDPAEAFQDRFQDDDTHNTDWGPEYPAGIRRSGPAPDEEPVFRDDVVILGQPGGPADDTIILGQPGRPAGELPPGATEDIITAPAG
jgi:hypothetical protein